MQEIDKMKIEDLTRVVFSYEIMKRSSLRRVSEIYLSVCRVLSRLSAHGALVREEKVKSCR